MSYEMNPSLRLARSNKFTSMPCDTCNKDTPHKGAVCIYCGKLSVNPIAERNARNKRLRATLSHNQLMWRGEQERFKLINAKREAEKRAAEESRKKWEGK
jgi:hypothetical protein